MKKATKLLILSTENRQYERSYLQDLTSSSYDNFDDIQIKFGDINSLVENINIDSNKNVYNTVVTNTDLNDISTLNCSKIVELLEKGGNFVLHAPLIQAFDEIKMSFMLAGLIDVKSDKGTFSGKTPSWEIGTTATITKKKKIFTLNLNDDDDMDLVNEDDLLEADIVEKKTEGSGDCSTKRRACKGCSCGRAEMESEMEAKGIKIDDLVEDEMPSSACGNCYKGDAFRCASCPYLGKPAFEKGNEKVILSLSDDI